MMHKADYKAADATFNALRPSVVLDTVKLPAIKRAAEEARSRFDDRSEKWQESENGCDEAERLELLETAVMELEQAIESLTAASDCLERLQNDAPEGSFD